MTCDSFLPLALILMMRGLDAHLQGWRAEQVQLAALAVRPVAVRMHAGRRAVGC